MKLNEELAERGELVEAQALTGPELAKIVVSDGKARLTEKELTATVEELLRKLKANPRLRLTIQWTLEEGPQ